MDHRVALFADFIYTVYTEQISNYEPKKLDRILIIPVTSTLSLTLSNLTHYPTVVSSLYIPLSLYTPLL